VLAGEGVEDDEADGGAVARAGDDEVFGGHDAVEGAVAEARLPRDAAVG
jgi:hypothetical protein